MRFDDFLSMCLGIVVTVVIIQIAVDIKNKNCGCNETEEEHITTSTGRKLFVSELSMNEAVSN
jgi:hypothetical protein